MPIYSYLLSNIHIFVFYTFIGHYAGVVKYDVSLFIAKNKDTLASDIEELLRGTSKSTYKFKSKI